VKFGVLEAKNRFSELIAAAERGEEVIVTKRGEPVARIVSEKGAANLRRSREAAWAEIDRIREAAFSRNGRVVATWEELKADRDEGRR